MSGAQNDEVSDAEVPEGFTLGLAVVDAIPVVEFSVSMIVIALRFQSVLFIIGAICCMLAGCGKVLWKLIMAIGKKDISWLSKQFRYLMGAGFVLMIVALILEHESLDIGAILLQAFSLPSGIFFVLGVVGMVAMAIMGSKLDRKDAKGNWIEQITNAVAQGMFLIGILLY